MPLLGGACHEAALAQHSYQAASAVEQPVRKLHHPPVRDRDRALRQHPPHRLPLAPGAEPARVHDERRRRGAAHPGLAVDEDPAVAQAEALGQPDDPPHVLLRGAEFRHHVGDEQTQLAGDVVVTDWQFVVRITDGDEVGDLGAAARRAEDVGGLGAARDLDRKLWYIHDYVRKSKIPLAPKLQKLKSECLAWSSPPGKEY